MRVWRWCLDAHRGTKTTNTFSASEELEKRILPAWSLTPGGLAEAASRFKVPLRQLEKLERLTGLQGSMCLGEGPNPSDGQRQQPSLW